MVGLSDSMSLGTFGIGAGIDIAGYLMGLGPAATIGRDTTYEYDSQQQELRAKLALANFQNTQTHAQDARSMIKQKDYALAVSGTQGGQAGKSSSYGGAIGQASGVGTGNILSNSISNQFNQQTFANAITQNSLELQIANEKTALGNAQNIMGIGGALMGSPGANLAKFGTGLLGMFPGLG